MNATDLLAQWARQCSGELALRIDGMIVDGLRSGLWGGAMNTLFVSNETFEAWSKDWWDMLRITMRMSGMNPDASFSSSVDDSVGGVVYIQEEGVESMDRFVLEVDGTLVESEDNLLATLKAAGFDPQNYIEHLRNPANGNALFLQNKTARFRSYAPRVFANKMMGNLYKSSFFSGVVKGGP